MTCQGWGYTSAVPALRTERKEDLQFKASLGNLMRPCLKKPRGGSSVVEHFPTVYSALSSITKKKKEEKVSK
jgi:hypothetical protein